MYTATSRVAEEALNLVLKALRKQTEQPEKYADPLDAIGDKAGVRVIVDDLDAREVVHKTLDACLEVLSFEDTAERYRPNELGYLGQHYQVRLLDSDLSTDESYLRGLNARCRCTPGRRTRGPRCPTRCCTSRRGTRTVPGSRGAGHAGDRPRVAVRRAN